MVKAINCTVESCIKCPYCKRESDKSVFEVWQYLCYKAHKLINGGKLIDTDTPIPKWCPLQDSSELKYFVVRERIEDVTDNYGMNMTNISEIPIGSETYILLSCEKDGGYTLADRLNHADEKNVVVILGRVITEKEVDLDLSNTQRKG